MKAWWAVISSSIIYREIASCQASIDSLRTSIDQLYKKIDKQEAALGVFNARERDYVDELANMRQWGQEVESHRKHVVFAERFKEKGDVELGQAKLGQMSEALGAIRQKLRNEIDMHQQALDERRLRLRSELNRMSWLQEEYRSTLVFERETLGSPK